MIVKKLKELYCVDTISQDKGWKKVQEAVGDLTEDLMIDFTNINVVEPWQCAEFKVLLKNKHIHMKFVNDEQLVKRIQMMCIIDGIDETRIINEVVFVPKEKTAEEKKIEKFGTELIPYFKVDDNGVATFKVSDRYSQVQSTNTLNYVDFAIRKVHEDKSIDKFVLDITGLVVLSNVLQFIAELMVQYNTEGITLEVNTDDSDNEEMNRIREELRLYIHQAGNEILTVSKRAQITQQLLKPNTPCMLMKYKKSKALDDFGREGNGEVISCRIAIFRKMKYVDENTTYAIVETFNNNYFYTEAQWMLEHDYEQLEDRHIEKLEIPLNELGICDTFLGSKYHLILPIQHDKSENQTVIKGVDADGKNIKVNCTIPERMQVVFDDWGIEYNKEELDKAIVATREYLDAEVSDDNTFSIKA